MGKRWVAVVVLVVGLVGAWELAGPTLAQPDPRPALRARLQFARPGGIYDPAQWRYTSDWFVYPNVFNWLVRWKPGPDPKELEPDLAERWTASADGLVYTFTLRRGVQFHKGLGELTAEDVVFSFERQMKDPKKSFYEALANIKAVEAVDRNTVRITLKERDGSFLWTVVSYRPGLIVSRRAVQQLGDVAFARSPVGTGPFEFVELTGRGEVVVRAHDGYFRGKPTVRQITFVHVGDENAAAAALRSGDLHIIWTRGNPEVVRTLRADRAVRTVRVIEYYNLFQVQFGPTFRPVQDVRVRRALAHAIDRRAIAAALPGLDEMAMVMRPPQLFGGTTDVPTYPFDLARARALLREAGYPNGFPLTLMVQKREPETTVAEILAAQWQAAGLDVKIEVIDPTAAFDRREKGTFDVTISATARPGDPHLFFWDVFHSDAAPPYGSNFFRYKDKDVDALIDAGRITVDERRREQIYVALQKKLMTDLPIIPLFYRHYELAYRDPVRAMTPGAFSMFWGETIRVR
ncbi:MAG: ABC transporter substrate-binding protein [Armatimonadota bacterium]|nr:ABC transporter substrate-binding protein [Armatimonadota bacterium]